MQFGIEMRDPLRRIELFERLDPFAMDRRIEQRGEPHRPRHARPVAHHRAQRLMADRTHLHLTCGVDIVIEPLERKAVQVDEVPRDMDTGDEPLVAALDGAEDVSLDQDRAAIGLDAAGQQTRTVVMLLDAFHQPLDILQIVEAEVVTQASGEEIAGQGEACRSQEFGGPVHRAR